jgi:hypothetical protein
MKVTLGRCGGCLWFLKHRKSGELYSTQHNNKFKQQLQKNEHVLQGIHMYVCTHVCAVRVGPINLNASQIPESTQIVFSQKRSEIGCQRVDSNNRIEQGCQMVFVFSYQNLNFGLFLRAKKREMLVYLMFFWNILPTFRLLNGHLVYLLDIWYI